VEVQPLVPQLRSARGVEKVQPCLIKNIRPLHGKARDFTLGYIMNWLVMLRYEASKSCAKSLKLGQLI
jgi:hypothetical protein